MSDIFVGLRVRAVKSFGTSPSNVGRVATVCSIDADVIFYKYAGKDTVYTITQGRFWNRFEEIADVKPAGVAATAGHCAGNGGLRGHSVGDVFPVVVYQRGTPGFITHWLRLPDGRDIGPYHSYDDVHRAAAWHKAQL